MDDHRPQPDEPDAFDAEVDAGAGITPNRPQMSRKAFLEKATERAGGRKPEAKKSVEAALAVLAEALAGGQDLNLPPLGRVRLVREKDNGRARVMTLRVTMPRSQALADDPADD